MKFRFCNRKIPLVVVLACFFAASAIAGFIPIEGTFIQAWLYARWDEPNYVGPKDAWDREAAYWKSLGVSQVIDGDIAYKNSGDPNWYACYESKLDSVVVECRDKDILMEKAHKYGFKVYMGLGVDNEWWNWDLTNDADFAKFRAAMMKAGAFAREIYSIYNAKYPENFAGFYSVYEVWNHNKLNYGDSTRNLYAMRLAEGFNILLDSLNQIDATKPLLFSQFATEDPYATDVSDGGPYGFGTLKNTELFWTKFFELAEFRSQDKTLPMDAVGGGGQRIDSVESWTKAYGDAVKNSKSKIGYYANIESFEQPPYHFLYDTERTPLYGRNYNSAAPVGRFARQIAVAERHTKGIFTFAFSHYHSPVNNIPGYYDVLLKYLKTGKGDTKAPTLPAKITIIDTVAKNGPLSEKLNTEILDKVFKFYWEGATDDNGIYRVKLNKTIQKNGLPYDSTFAYSVSTRTESGVVAHEPDTIYFAYSTGRECIGIEHPEEEDCYNPRYKGEDDYVFVVADVWGNETVSKPFTLKSTGGRYSFTPELDSVRMYKIPEKDSLRSYFAIDSAWVQDVEKPMRLPSVSHGHGSCVASGAKCVQIVGGEFTVVGNGADWRLRYDAKIAGTYRLSIFTAFGSRLFVRDLHLDAHENWIDLPKNETGYSRFFIHLRKK